VRHSVLGRGCATVGAVLGAGFGAYLCILLLALHLALGPGNAVAALPQLGDPASDTLSPGLERRLGESIMRDLRSVPAAEEDPDVSAYLEDLGMRLVEAGGGGHDFEFFLVRDSSLNAFALPGGFIGVHSGLIAAAESESELAGVLAHEIGHVTQRHIARMLARSREAGIAQMVGMVLAALAARSNPQAATGFMALGQQIGQDQMLSFSRDAEREADRIGFDTLNRAGFDPQGMVSFFERIQRAGRVYESGAPSYLRTHPLTTERIADMQARVRSERYRQWADSLGFRLMRARTQALLDPSVEGLRRAAERFEGQLRERSTLDPVAAWYGLATVRETQRRWRDALVALEQASLALSAQNAQQLPAHDGAAASALGRLEVNALAGLGRIDEAIARSRALSSLHPGNDRLRHQEMALLLQARRYAEARQLGESILGRRPQDVITWSLLARVHAEKGERALMYRARGEVHLIGGALPMAIEQFRLAQSAKDAGAQENLQIDARLRFAMQRWQAERIDSAARTRETR
jgi:predicted Zn-dependent protease